MFHATAKVVADVSGFVTVDVYWSHPTKPIDRSCTYGIGLSRKIAERFVKAVNAQKAFINPRLMNDVNFKTYVEAECLVYGRRASSDLKKLGF